MSRFLPPLTPGDRLETLEMTEERKERLVKACSDLVDWLKQRTEAPIEAFMVLDLTKDALADHFKIKASAFIPKDGAQA